MHHWHNIREKRRPFSPLPTQTTLLRLCFQYICLNLWHIPNAICFSMYSLCFIWITSSFLPFLSPTFQWSRFMCLNGSSGVRKASGTFSQRYFMIFTKAKRGVSFCVRWKKFLVRHRKTQTTIQPDLHKLRVVRTVKKSNKFQIFAQVIDEHTYYSSLSRFIRPSCRSVYRLNHYKCFLTLAHFVCSSASHWKCVFYWNITKGSIYYRNINVCAICWKCFFNVLLSLFFYSFHFSVVFILHRFLNPFNVFQPTTIRTLMLFGCFESSFFSLSPSVSLLGFYFGWR